MRQTRSTNKRHRTVRVYKKQRVKLWPRPLEYMSKIWGEKKIPYVSTILNMNEVDGTFNNNPTEQALVFFSSLRSNKRCVWERKVALLIATRQTLLYILVSKIAAIRDFGVARDRNSKDTTSLSFSYCVSLFILCTGFECEHTYARSKLYSKKK